MTGIEWTDRTWNPVIGCSVVSPGCTNCYAMRMAARLEAMSVAHEARHGGDPGPMRLYQGLTQETSAGAVWTGRTAFVEAALDKPFHWRRPRRVFVCSMSDLFHESVSDETLDRVWAVMALCPHLTFQVLTKRPERARDYVVEVEEETLEATLKRFAHHMPMPLPKGWVGFTWPLPNVWLGTSVEDQARAEQRIPLLLETPAAVRFLSCEPLLGQVNLHWIALRGTNGLDALAGEIEERETGAIRSTAKLDWIISGGESGPGARPMHPDWIRSIRDQCQAAGTAFFFKQWGAWVSVSEVEGEGPHYSFPDGATVRRVGKKAAGRTLDGAIWDQMPGSDARDRLVRLKSMSDTFTCAVCGETFVKGRTDQEAAAEYARLFPDAEPVEQAALICDGCYRYGQSQGWIPGEA